MAASWLRARLRQRRLCRGEPRDRHAERRAANVVQSDFLEELDRLRIAAVLAADAELQGWPRLTSFRDRDVDELPDAGRVDGRERVLLHDRELGVRAEERAGVVARER